ncbi:MAG: 6-hydroxymethylpterin diphosphokinase MptE-like protein [Parcubacteria group bacterium]
MRIRFTEITPKRVYDAALRRVQDIPDSLAWKRSAFSEANRTRLNCYRDCHRGQRCFVMANGPSLGRMDMGALGGEYTVSMNRAYLLYEQWGFTPSYYVCINELVLEQFATDVARLPMPRFLNFNRRQLFPISGEDYGLMYLRLGLKLRDLFCGDVTDAISSGGTVTFACLQLAYFMGFEEVILIGMDHNFVEKGVPNTTEVRQSDRDESHCHPDYVPKGIKWQLPDLYRSELAYAMARQAFERDGRRIVDATVDGKCDVFPKVDFKSLF